MAIRILRAFEARVLGHRALVAHQWGAEPATLCSVALADDITVFLRRVAPAIASQITAECCGRSLVVMEDVQGIAIANVRADSLPPHEMIASLMRSGASGAAYVSYLPRRHEVFVQVLVADPLRSDVRRARVMRDRRGVIVGPWEYTITG